MGGLWLRYVDRDIDDWGELLTSLLRWGNKTMPQISHKSFEWRRGPLIKQPIFLQTL